MYKSLLSKQFLKLSIFMLMTSIILIGIFSLLRGNTLHASELSFSEHSILGKDAGAVLPASCESSPPSAHFTGDCTPVTNLQFNSTSNFLNVKFTTNNTRVNIGEASVGTWEVQGASSCSASGAWSGAKNPGGGSEIIVYGDGSGADYIFLLTCTNGSRSVTKGIRIHSVLYSVQNGN